MICENQWLAAVSGVIAAGVAAINGEYRNRGAKAAGENNGENVEKPINGSNGVMAGISVASNNAMAKAAASGGAGVAALNKQRRGINGGAIG